MQAETYNKLFTHARRDDGLLLPDPVDPGGAGQLPGADDDRGADLAFPRLNLLSWYLFMIGGLVHALRDARRGGVDTGWTFYTPYSSIFSNTHVDR